MSERPKIIARSLADARRELEELAANGAIVSIGSPETKAPEGFEPSNPLHLRLKFDDVTSDTPSLRSDSVSPPRRHHIETLIDRASDLLTARVIYCHCAAGISRSTAAAFILQCIKRGPGRENEAMRAVLEDNPFASPNRLMVRLADGLLERDGRMVDAIEEVRRRLDSRSD